MVVCVAIRYFGINKKIFIYLKIVLLRGGAYVDIYPDLANQRDKRNIEMTQIPNDETVTDPLKQWIVSNRF